MKIDKRAIKVYLPTVAEDALRKSAARSLRSISSEVEYLIMESEKKKEIEHEQAQAEAE